MARHSGLADTLRLDPDAMLVFAAIARHGGVRGAATRLGTPRSTVSRKLVQLEKDVGASLVVRTGRRFALTELGASFAVECESLERVLGSAEELVRRRRSEPSGVLRVFVAPVLGEEILPRVLSELLAKYPRLSIDARLSVDYVDLRRSAVDVALRAATIDDATDLFAVKLGTSISGCYASPSYLKKRGRPTTPSMLSDDDHDCITVGQRSKPSWPFRSGSRDLEAVLTSRIRVDNFRVARDLAVRGAGIVRVARVFADPLVASGDLVPLLEPYWLAVPVYAVHAGPNPPTPSVRAFIDTARSAVEETLGAPPQKQRRWRSA
jgi:DNA-binding transcriptional LysR family regulator